jgi:hypothetical protein
MQDVGLRTVTVVASEPVNAGSGFITVRKDRTGAVTQTLPVTSSSLVAFSADGMTVTLHLDASAIDQEMDNYTVIVPAGAFRDRASAPNMLEGFDIPFETAPDVEPLLLLGVAPANETADVAILGVSDLVLRGETVLAFNFSKPIQLMQGTLTVVATAIAPPLLLNGSGSDASGGPALQERQTIAVVPGSPDIVVDGMRMFVTLASTTMNLELTRYSCVLTGDGVADKVKTPNFFNGE